VLLLGLGLGWSLGSGLAGCATALPDEERIALESAAGLPALEQTLQARVEAEPGDAAARRLLALVLLRQGRLEPAQEHALAAIRAAPFFAPALETLGRVYQARGLRQRALNAFGQAIALDPDLLPAYLGYALVSESLGERERGLETLREGLRRAPHHYALRYHQARLLGGANRLEEAEAAVEQARRVRPEASEALALQIAIYRMRGRGAAARLLAERGLERTPEDRALRFALADLLRGQEDWTAARAAFTPLERSGPLSPREALLRVEILDGEGRTGEARQALEALLRSEPGFVPARILLGRLLVRDGRWKPALEELERASALEPTAVEALYWSAVARFQLHETDTGATLLSVARRIAPERPSLRLLEMARLLAANRPEAVKPLLEAFLAEHPGDGEGLLLRVELLTLQGAYQEARAALDGIAPAFRPAERRFALARLDYLQGRFAAVLEHTAPERAPPALAWREALLRGSTLWRLNRTAEALAVLEPVLARQEGGAAVAYRLGYLYRLEGDAVRAEKTFLTGLTRFPRDPLLVEGLSRLALEGGEWARASELLEEGVEREGPYRALFLERLLQAGREEMTGRPAREALDRTLREGDPLRAPSPGVPTAGVLFGTLIPAYRGH
jgi:tetratricopeptide (TPR) repeat protein